MPPITEQEPVKWDPDDTYRDPSLPKIIQDLPFDVSRRQYFPNPYVSECWDNRTRAACIKDFMADYGTMGHQLELQQHMTDYIRIHSGPPPTYFEIEDYDSISEPKRVKCAKVDVRAHCGETLWDDLQAARDSRKRHELRNKSRKLPASVSFPPIDLTHAIQSQQSSKQGPSTPDMSIHLHHPHNREKDIFTMFIEVKWTSLLHPMWSEVDAKNRPKTYITFEGRDTNLPADAFSCTWLEAVCETMWYVYAGSVLSSAEHGIAIFNEYFVRILMIKDAVGKNVMAVEVHPSVTLIAAQTAARPVLPFRDFLIDPPHNIMWQHPPNSLFTYPAGAVRRADEEAFARLSAFIHLGFFLAATATPPSLGNTANVSLTGTHEDSLQGFQVTLDKTHDEDPSGSPDLPGQDALDHDALEMGDSSSNSADNDPRKGLLVANVPVLLLHPFEMDALIHRMHGGLVRAPSADLRDWFLSVDPSPPPTSSAPV